MGRKSISHTTAQTWQIVHEAASIGVKLVRDYIDGKDRAGKRIKPLSQTKLKACLSMIHLSIGTPRQSVDLTTGGEPLTIKQLAERAVEHWELKEGQEPEQPILEPSRVLEASKQVE